MKNILCLKNNVFSTPMKCLNIIVLSLFICLSPGNVGLSYADKEKIAIFDCVDGTGGKFKSYAEGVADIFIDIFTRSSKLTLLERSQLRKAMQELEGISKGKFEISDDDALSIGQSLGATKVIVSKLTKSRKKITLNSRIIDVGTKEIVLAKKAKASVENYDYLSDKVAGKLLSAYTQENVLDEDEIIAIAKMDNFENIQIRALKKSKEQDTAGKVKIIETKQKVDLLRVDLERERLNREMELEKMKMEQEKMKFEAQMKAMEEERKLKAELDQKKLEEEEKKRKSEKGREVMKMFGNILGGVIRR